MGDFSCVIIRGDLKEIEENLSHKTLIHALENTHGESISLAIPQFLIKSRKDLKQVKIRKTFVYATQMQKKTTPPKKKAQLFE